MRRFLNRRTLLIAMALLLLIVLSGSVALYWFVNSPEFNQRIHDFVVERTATYTGTQVTVQNIRWSLRDQRLVVENLTLRGTEAASEPPLAHLESITAGIHLRSLLDRHVDLFELTVTNPEFNLRVDSEGRTNLPGPPKREEGLPESRLTLSIDSLKVTGGKITINDRHSNLDFAISDLISDLRYRQDTEILSARVSYKGTVQSPKQFSIPYTLSSEFDFTRGTIVAQKVMVASDKSSATLQGRIDKALTPEITAKLDYSGNFDSKFLKHFLSADTINGTATSRGMLEFSSGILAAQGDLASSRIEWNGWNASALKANYTYRYPEKQLNLTKLAAAALGGNAEGSVIVTALPGQPRVVLDLDYRNIDAAELVRAYPWDPKYRIYSRVDGHMQGWFEGPLAQYEFSGDSLLTAYSPDPAPGIVSLPASGPVMFVLKPGEAEIKGADLRLLETAIRADGKITGTQADLTVNLVSTNLANLAFLYPDANGKGSFKGTVKGPLPKPVLDGDVTLDSYKFREWTIQHAAGAVNFDAQTGAADLKDVALTIGESTATINGSASLDGASVNLRIHSDHVRPDDFSSLIQEKVGGILSGDVTLTSLNPLKVAGRVKAVGLTARGHTLEAFAGDLTYNDPAIEIRNATASELGADLKAEILEYNRSTQALNVKADVTSLAFERLRDLGVPETLRGNIQKAHVTVTGTQARPQIAGNATIENLGFRNETFPLATLAFTTTWPHLNATLSGVRNVTVSADVDLAAAAYPFKAMARFQNYSVEQLANFSQGTLTASGEATFEGELNGQAPLSGKGTISSIEVHVRDYVFEGAKPFPFSFDSNRLRLTDGAAFSGAYSTLLNLEGSIGLTAAPPLDLRVSGNLDLSEITAAYQAWSVTGLVKVNAQVGGTATDPTISGTANISNGSLGHEGIYPTLSGLAGDVRFNENRVTFDNVEGHVGGGVIRLVGTSLIQNSRLEGLNVRIDADQVRLRYPAGLRSTVTGSLVLKGTSDEPSLEGSLRLDSMAYRSDFEPFLAMFRPGGLNSGGTALDKLRLSIHIAGNRNISVQNELTNVTSARMDLDIKGTWGSPTLTGHVVVEEGTLSFQGKRYDLTRGNIDFVDPLKIEPVVDIQAEADLRDYRVILSITGRSDRIRVEFRSDPPLPQLELISLIAGGKTREELNNELTRTNENSVTGGTQPGNASLPTSEQLFQGGAVSILADLLRSKVGSRFGLMGLDWIRIDPHFETAASNPSLRVTLSQRVSKDLSVTYSQDLATTQQRLIMIEYFLSKNLSIVASREETNETSALGLDVKLRRRF